MPEAEKGKGQRSSEEYDQRGERKTGFYNGKTGPITRIPPSLLTVREKRMCDEDRLGNTMLTKVSRYATHHSPNALNCSSSIHFRHKLHLRHAGTSQH